MGHGSVRLQLPEQPSPRAGDPRAQKGAAAPGLQVTTWSSPYSHFYGSVMNTVVKPKRTHISSNPSRRIRALCNRHKNQQQRASEKRERVNGHAKPKRPPAPALPRSEGWRRRLPESTRPRLSLFLLLSSPLPLPRLSLPLLHFFLSSLPRLLSSSPSLSCPPVQGRGTRPNPKLAPGRAQPRAGPVRTRRARRLPGRGRGRAHPAGLTHSLSSGLKL